MHTVVTLPVIALLVPHKQARFSLEVAAEMAFKITSVRSPSHTVAVKRVGPKAMIRLALANANTMLQEDFVVQVCVSCSGSVTSRSALT